MARLEFEYVRSATAVDQLPGTRCELAVVGRSNVGKSSLLNAVSGRKHLAHTSKTPGRTQTLNLFALGGDGTRTMVDCPGYGYAATSKTTRAAWQPMIERYLVERDGLTMVLVLVDGEIGPTKLDVQMLDWLRENALPHTVVATKHDKVRPAKRDKRRRELAQGCMLDPGDVVWVSAVKQTGIDRLRDLVRLWLDA
ncbi:MAG TPA: ribosome biogenesis GTP-binding protein YihA/YsxC [Acidimicrobiia bacterium]|jgi:GTP-binding protein|nr:ribosome biogenesis GTP-binding protein YihA/YsxC [Acidimicrobiia bacterium]